MMLIQYNDIWYMTFMTSLNVKKELLSTLRVSKLRVSKLKVSKPSKEKEPIKSVATVRKSINSKVVFD